MCKHKSRPCPYEQVEMNASASPTDKKLTVFHFNDVYNIEPSDIEPYGGAARLMTAYMSIKDRNPLVLFSGDCLNPSMGKSYIVLLSAGFILAYHFVELGSDVALFQFRFLFNVIPKLCLN